ncbi:MAG: ABC transporter ATP-binding protein/permease [Saccharofermentans sp.]|nr:ABC transporter ATP-binding protein/permease [Mageeibacillus sp.]MCI1264919.1 ABC transporter ATP-binding protein/permease [Saccharofermentans sp.]MCI1275625.1 ABC transporter ATP-binding protein/permease [Saccharofermentans sp.]MCI1768789.1 ABC transporter ATP-binding protein/permease [Mageeibacillus sp.]
MVGKLLRSLRQYKKETVLTLVFIIGEVIMEVIIPFITSDMVNNIKNGANMGDILKTGGLMVVAAVFSLACGALAGNYAAKASAGFAGNLRSDLFAKVQSFSFSNIDKFSTSSLVTRMTTDVTNVQNSYMMIIRTAVRSPLMLVFAIVMASVMGGPLALTFAVIVPVLVFGLFLIGKTAMPAFRAVFRKYDKLNESIEENVRGMRVVKGFAREDYESGKLKTASENIRVDFTKAERIVGLNGPLMEVCMYFNTAFVLYVGAKLVVSSRGTIIDIGQISAMLTYGVMVLMSLMMISMVYVMITMSVESMKRIVEVIDEKPSISNPENPVMNVRDGGIEFSNVAFKYSDKALRNALYDINLHITSGMTVGILGGTGSSKTTLIQLISRLYDVTEGSVCVGGVDVRDYDIKTLRDAVSVVLQKNELFSGTIAENLRWGNSNATDEELADACRTAQADEFIRSFPDGYDTHIEQGGTNVSGGQKQRLCIARALLKHPAVLILDDSTSAVDTRTDALIRKGFRENIPDTTKIIIAQRIASVQDADMIVIMNNGHIEGTGTHEELLKSSQIYRETYEDQTKGDGSNE